MSKKMSTKIKFVADLDSMTRDQWVEQALIVTRDAVQTAYHGRPVPEVVHEETGYRDAGGAVRIRVVGRGHFEAAWAETTIEEFTTMVRDTLAA